MEISFRSLDRGKAAQIANAISDAYIVDQLEAKYQSTRRAGLLGALLNLISSSFDSGTAVSEAELQRRALAASD